MRALCSDAMLLEWLHMSIQMKNYSEICLWKTRMMSVTFCASQGLGDMCTRIQPVLNPIKLLYFLSSFIPTSSWSNHQIIPFQNTTQPKSRHDQGFRAHVLWIRTDITSLLYVLKGTRVPLVYAIATSSEIIWKWALFHLSTSIPRTKVFLVLLRNQLLFKCWVLLIVPISIRFLELILNPFTFLPSNHWRWFVDTASQAQWPRQASRRYIPCSKRLVLDLPWRLCKFKRYLWFFFNFTSQ